MVLFSHCGAVWPLIILTGMHRVFTPTIIETIGKNGYEPLFLPAQIGANIGMGGACLAVAYKTKNLSLKQSAKAAAASAIFAGVTEPALYGVLVRLKRPLVATMMTGFIIGGLTGVLGIVSYSLAAPSLLTSVQFFNVEHTMTVVWVLGLIALTIPLSFVITLILGFKDISEDVTENDQPSSGSQSTGDITSQTPNPARVK